MIRKFQGRDDATQRQCTTFGRAQNTNGALCRQSHRRSASQKSRGAPRRAPHAPQAAQGTAEARGPTATEQHNQAHGHTHAHRQHQPQQEQQQHDKEQHRQPNHHNHSHRHKENNEDGDGGAANTDKQQTADSSGCQAAVEITHAMSLVH